ncbi:hypothetical protein ACLB2K_022042 [Fragaria x ananassa]
MGTELPSSSFASSSNTQWTYDIFLSFRGEDTRKSFTVHLYAALDQEGIFAFRDDEELDIGQPISSKLMEAILVSRILLVVISRNYASLTWCLDELTAIVECMEDRGQRVFPIFYDVDPCDVRKQIGWFEQAFVVHEERFKDDSEKEKMQKWRAALTRVANLSGFHLQNRYESKFIQEIVGKIVNELSSTIQQPHSDDLGLVGINFGLEEIMKLCSATDEGNDVVFVGIWGMGGVGKTTLAQAFYDKISDQFRDKCFLKNVREISTREDTLEQLRALVGSNNWFGRGSRIIITTRDKQLLIAHHVDRCYKVKELRSDDAFKLFSWIPFKNDHPPKDYIELSHNFVNYSKGLPLAIKVLGSFLCGLSLQEWDSAFSRIQENLDKDIMSALRISFDGLHEKEKQIFLDIACFFKGQDRDEVTILLEGFGFDPIIGISALIRKSLITILGSRLWMHDLLQEMGWELVRGECLNKPGNRSRLWESADALDLLKYHEGSDAVQGIVLSLPQEQKEQLKRDALSNMKKLRFLRISNVLLPLGLSYLSTELRALEWHGYPLKLLPTGFPSEKLVQLDLCGSHIKHLWKGFRCVDKLKSIDLKDSASLIETPDFTGVPNLEKLILEGCSKLIEIPENIGNVECLEESDISGTAIRKMPSSIVYLKNLKELSCVGCDGQLSTSLLFPYLPEVCPGTGVLSPASFSGFSSLMSLNLSYCNLFDGALPNYLDHMSSLKELNLRGNNFTSIPESISRLSKLLKLQLDGCSMLQSLPKLPLSLKEVWATGCMSLESDSDQSWSHLWFSTRLDAFNKCSSIEAYTIIDSPYVEVKMSGARLLYERRDFIEFVQASRSETRASRIMQNKGSSVSLLAADGSCKIDSSISLKKHLSLLPSDLECYEGQSVAGFKYYLIVGSLFHPQTSSLLGEILQKYSGQHSVFYRETFPRYGIPEWFCSVNSSSAAFTLNPMTGWKGIAACAVFTVLDNLDSENPYINCTLEIGCQSIAISGCINESLISLKVRGFIGMFYASRGSLSYLMSNDCTSIKAWFDSNSKNIMVQSCGHQIVFNENMEEFMETMLQCSLTSMTSQLSKDTIREENRPTARRLKIENEKKKSPWRSICCFSWAGV